MSTRGHICIKLRPEDLDKDLPLFDIHHKIIGSVHTNKNFPYMYVYCHHDSYEEKPGLGYRLPRNLKNYMDVRNFILQGNRTSFDTPYTECGEDIEDNRPKMVFDINGEIPEDYFYVFEDNHWKVKSSSESIEGKPFRDIEYKEATIEINEKEMEAILYILHKYEKILNVIDELDHDHYLIVSKFIRGIEKKINESK